MGTGEDLHTNGDGKGSSEVDLVTHATMFAKQDIDSNILVKCGPSHLPSCPAIPPRTQQQSPQRENAQQRQSFDRRKDDPVRFSNMTRPKSPKPPTPSPPSSMGYVSASSTSSYAQATVLSNFTLSTDGLSASSVLFEGKPRLETVDATIMVAQ